jgi:hypothetical protein
LVAPKRLPGFSFFQLTWVLGVKSIETHASAFLTLNILSIGTVSGGGGGALDEAVT